MRAHGSHEILKVVVGLVDEGRPIFYEADPTGKTRCDGFEMPMMRKCHAIERRCSRSQKSEVIAAYIRIMPSNATGASEMWVSLLTLLAQKYFRRRL
jgi:hypothetical protein